MYNSKLAQSFIVAIPERTGSRAIATSSHGFGESALNAAPMTLVDAIGGLGAVLTTVCWLPQALQIVRERDTRAISLPATAGFAAGILLWLVYGAALVDWPLIASSAVTLALMLVILGLKIRHG